MAVERFDDGQRHVVMRINVFVLRDTESLCFVVIVVPTGMNPIENISASPFHATVIF